MSSFRRTIIRALILLILSLSISMLVFAGGQKEDPLETVDRYIQEKNYDEAYSLLGEILSEDPEQLDPIQERMAVIEEKQAEISGVEKQIFKAAKEEDTVAMLELLKLIEQLEPKPNEERANTLSAIKLQATVIENRKQVTAIMEKALAEIRAGEYWEATGTYLTGFNIGKSLFLSSRFGNIIETQVDAVRGNVETSAQRLIGLEDIFSTSVENISSALRNGTVSSIKSSFKDLFGYLVDIGTTRNEILRESGQLAAIYENLRLQQEDKKEIYYLRYLTEYISGRRDLEDEEGILFMFDKIWDPVYLDVRENLSSQLESVFTRGLASFSAFEWQDANEAFRASIEMARLNSEASSLLEISIYPEKDLGISPEDLAIVSTELERLLHFRVVEDTAEAYLDSQPLIARTNQLEMYTDETSLFELASIRRTAVDLEDDLTANSSEIEKRLLGYSNYDAAGLALEEELEPIYSLRRLVDAGITKAVGLETDVVTRSAELQVQSITARIEPEKQKIEEGRVLLEGQKATGDEGEDVEVLVVKHPDQSIPVFRSALNNLGVIKTDATDIERDLNQEKPRIVADERMQSSVETTQSQQLEIEAAMNELDGLIEKAAKQIALATDAREQAYTLLSQANTAYQNEEFEFATTRINQASDAAISSVSYQDDKEFESDFDEKKQVLWDAIIRSQKAFVIAEVRKLITSSRVSLGQKDYEEANSDLLSARELWFTVNSEENPEIEYWLGIVQLALQVTVDQEIAETHPLYPEVQQRLNYAQKAINDGLDLLDKDDKVGATRKFDDAGVLLVFVLANFPQNQDANFLVLRIEQVTDPDKFRQGFNEKLNEAQEKLGSEPADAYTELQTLLQFEPENPQLLSAYTEAKYILGFEQRPPDPKKLAESDALYNKALEIVNSEDQENYQTAIDYLDDALDANPDNIQAQELKDSINITVSPTAVATISTEDERRYQQAIQLYLDGSYLRAYSITLDLLRNDVNKNYRPLKELHSKLEEVVGV